ncbi:MAG TPA: TRAP transporter small permease subunit [Gammaproteobacteria bacterium]|nr:TRAP transporter small permease subunit [Gammaproteobacteria bacterium]
MATRNDPFPQRLLAWIDALISFSGRSIAWLVILMVLISFSVAILRYLFDIGWIALQESVTYLHALVFMLGIPYTLNRNRHVRVDILNHRFSPRTRAWVDLFGTLVLLLPVFITLFWLSLNYVTNAWLVLEASPEAGGLPLVFLLKSLLLLMPLLMILQGIAWLLRNMLFLTGKIESSGIEQ